MPSLSLLEQRQILTDPSLLEQIRNVLHLSPSPSDIQVMRFEDSWWHSWFPLQQEQMIGRERFQIILVIEKLGTECRASSSSVWWRSIELRSLLTMRIILSHTPPWCKPAGGLKLPQIPTCERTPSICWWLSAATVYLSSLSASTNLVPLSEIWWDTYPLLLVRALTQASVSKEAATPRWTALLVRQLNMAPYRLQVPLPFFTSTGPK